ATASRTFTLPDVGSNSTFAMLDGAQTFVGAKTFSGGLTSTTGTFTGVLDANLGLAVVGGTVTDTLTVTGLTASAPVRTTTGGLLTTGATSLTTEVSGILPLANGGTNNSL